jgi:RimJ/RimL family protein N-acetyltransferase
MIGGDRGDNEVVIRRARAADAIEIARVHVASYRTIYRGIMLDSQLAAFSEATRERVFSAYIAEGRYPIDVLELDRIVGFCGYGPARDEDKAPERCCELQAIYLDPSVWRRGYGAQMTRRVIDYASEHGYDEVVLWVLERNAPARAFYERLGFAPDGATKVLEDGDWRATEMRYRTALG